MSQKNFIVKNGLTVGNVVVDATTDNITGVANLTATGNITASFYYGDGSFLTGLAPTLQSYLFSNDLSTVSPYYQSVYITEYNQASPTANSVVTVGTTGTLLVEFLTNINYPGLNIISAGQLFCRYETQKASGTKAYTTYAELYKRTSGGVETLLLTSDLSTSTAVNTQVQQLVGFLNTTTITLDPTDRLAVKLYGYTSSGTDSITTTWGDNTDSGFDLPTPPASVTQFVPYTGALSNIDLGNHDVTTTGNVTASFFSGNGSQLTGIIPTSIANGNSNVRIATANGNVTIASAGNTTMTVTGTGANITGTANVTGNVSASYFKGNGSQLTGISATSFANGNSNINIATIDGNIDLVSNGNVTMTVTETGVSITGNANVVGNITANYFVGNGYFLTDVALTPTSDETDADFPIVMSDNGQLITSSDASRPLINALTGKVTVDRLDVGDNGIHSVSGNLFLHSGSNLITFNSNGNLEMTSSGNITGANLVIANYFVGQLGVANSNIQIEPDDGNIYISAQGGSGSSIDYIMMRSKGNTVITVKDLGANVTGYVNASGNVSANYFLGNGSSLTNITGANVEGQVANALIAGTVYTNAQPNITSVGTLSSLAVTANITAGNANLGNLATANYVTGTLTTAAQPNITSVGTLSSLTVATTITAGSVFANGGTISATALSGLLSASSNAQTNIKSVGTLNSLAVTGNITTAGSVYANSGTIGASLLTGTLTTNAQPNITSVGILTTLRVTGNINANTAYLNANGVNANTGSIDDFVAVTANATTVNATTANATTVNATTVNATTVNATSLIGTLTTNAQPNITSVGTLTDLNVSGNSNLGNLATANFFQGDGGLLSNLSAGSTIANGNSNVNIATANGNVNISSEGNANILVVTGTGANITGTANVTGNVSAGNLTTSTAIITTGNITTINSGLMKNGNSNVTIASNGAVTINSAGALAMTVGTSGTTVVGNLTATNFIGALVNGNSNVRVFANGRVETVVQGSTVLSVNVGTANVTGNFKATNSDLGNLAVANFFSGNGASLTNVAAVTADTVTTASQPNITSVGTLTSLDVTGNVTAGKFIGNGALLTNVIAVTANTVTNNAQPNITSLGTLTGLGITGNVDLTGNFNVTGNLNYSNVNDLVVGDPLIYIGANNTGDIFDLGIVASYSNGVYQHTGLARDATDGVWKLFSNVVTEPTTVIDFANGIYAPFKSGAIQSTGNVTANFFVGDGTYLTNVGNAQAIVNGNSNVNIGTANGNITLSASGNANVVVVTGTGANVAGNVTSSNSLVAFGGLDGQIIVGGSSTAGSIEIGKQGRTSVGTPYVDFHSSVDSPDYDVRLIVSGGNSTSGSGNLDITASQVNISGALSVTGNVTGNYFIGNGSQLTDLTATSLASGTSNVRIATTNGNVTLVAGGSTTLTVTNSGANIAGYVTATGNLTSLNANLGNLAKANFFQGDGTQLSNVTARIANKISNGNSNVSVDTANGNVTITSAGITTLTVTNTGANIEGYANISGTANISGNVTTAGQFVGSGTYLTDVAHPPTTDGANVDFPIVLSNGGVLINADAAAFPPTINGYNGKITADGFAVGATGINAVTGNSLSITVAGNVFTFNTNGALLMPGSGEISSNVISANYITSTLTTDANAQPNITSVGTLISLAVTGDANIDGSANIVGSATIGETVTANFFVGNGYQMTGVAHSPVDNTANTEFPIVMSDVGTLAIPGGFGYLPSINPSSGSIGAKGFYVGVDGIMPVTGNTVNVNVAGNVFTFSTTADFIMPAFEGEPIGNITGANIVSATTFSGANLALTGNANLGNVATANYFTGTLTTNAQPNITSVGTLISLAVTGNANVGNLGTTGLITATGNVTGGNLTTGGILAVTGNANVSGNLNVTTGNVKIGASITANAANGNISANFFVGNAAGLTGVSNISSLTNGNSNVIVSANSNITMSVGGTASVLVLSTTGANIKGTANITGNANIGNINTATIVTGAGTGGNITGANNITANYFIGNVNSEASFAIQSANFTANGGGRYGVNTATIVVYALLPAAPVTGAAIFFADSGGAFATNNLIINPNGKTIMGSSSNLAISTNGQSTGIFYNGSTWRTYN